MNGEMTLPPVDFQPLEGFTSELPRVERYGHRYYQTPEGNCYPSVTTVIGNTSDQSWLDGWIAAVGQEKADKITRLAAERGNELHRLMECWIEGTPAIPSIPLAGYMAKSLVKEMAPHIGTVYASEGRSYSDRFQVAGTMDCLGLWDGVLSVIDFKTARKVKAKADIPGYFIQGTFYALMVWERFGLKAKQIVVPIASETGKSVVYTEPVESYYNLAKEKVIQFYQKYPRNPDENVEKTV